VIRDLHPRQEAQTLTRVVLLVEDHFATRWAAAEYLRHAGFRVIEAVNVAEAKTILQTATHVDVVFSDINMPGADDGYILAQWLATHYPTLPTLLTSGEPEDSRAYSKSGLREFARKPYNLDAIVAVINRLLGT
jgi:DNA-binding NtrC family response regulator